jgi:hypothetical protein
MPIEEAVMTQTDAHPGDVPAPPTVTLDLYREVHKGIRRSLFALCEAAGSLDADDATACDAFVARFAAVDRMLTLHHDHEDGELGQLVAEVAPQFTAELDAGHHRAVEGLADLRRQVIVLADGGDADALYDRVTAFVVEYLGHMAVEEHQVMPALSAACTFDELLAVQVGIRTTIPPTDMVLFLRSMLPAMNTHERTSMLGGMRAGAPPEVFDVFWSTAVDVLTSDQLAVVAGRLDAVAVAS